MYQLNEEQKQILNELILTSVKKKRSSIIRTWTGLS